MRSVHGKYAASLIASHRFKMFTLLSCDGQLMKAVPSL